MDSFWASGAYLRPTFGNGFYLLVLKVVIFPTANNFFEHKTKISTLTN
jgi:hypothetical protein